MCPARLSHLTSGGCAVIFRSGSFYKFGPACLNVVHEDVEIVGLGIVRCLSGGGAAGGVIQCAQGGGRSVIVTGTDSFLAIFAVA